MPKGLAFILLMALMVVSNGVFGHQQKAAETTVLFNKNTNKLEVMHRFYLHDTEHAVQSLFDKNADILNSDQTHQQFAKYVAEQFMLSTLNNTKLPLANIGSEIDGKFFWVYQETALPKELTGLKLFNGSLRELWPTQINMVNIEGAGKIRTLYFSDNQTWLIAKF
jgi:hypothetical protein